MLAYTTFTAAFASSIFSAAIPAVAKHFGVGREVGVLGTSFYVLGESQVRQVRGQHQSDKQHRICYWTHPLGPVIRIEGASVASGHREFCLLGFPNCSRGIQRFANRPDLSILWWFLRRMSARSSSRRFLGHV